MQAHDGNANLVDFGLRDLQFHVGLLHVGTVDGAMNTGVADPDRGPLQER